MSNNSYVSGIDSAGKEVRDLYNQLLESDLVGKTLIIDGQRTRGQIKDKERVTNTREENTKTVTCRLDCSVKRGSSITIVPSDDSEQELQGVVQSVPNKNPTDYYFTVLLFNSVVERQRITYVYNDDGDIVDEKIDSIKNIPAFVERIGIRERQVDVGIDRNSVNRMYSTYEWDIKKGDIIVIKSNKFLVNDIEELDEEVLNVYMTYYRN